MARGYGGWAPYVPVAERRKKAAREMEKLRKKGHPVSPVTIEGRTIARTFWGRAWCDNLERYRDYENRLPRGRTYVRNGSVVDLQIKPLEIRAMVSGSSIYSVGVTIKALAPTQWRSACADCAGSIDSLVELLQGRFSKSVMERLCRQDQGLFPKPSEIRFSCSCPDGASMCKHVAAVLYGVGARLDDQPELLFRLRGVDENELVADIKRDLPFSSQPPAPAKVLDTDDLSALFGLDLASVTDPPGSKGGEPAISIQDSQDGHTAAARKRTRRKAAVAAASPTAAGSTLSTPSAKSHPAKKGGEPTEANSKARPEPETSATRRSRAVSKPEAKPRPKRKEETDIALTTDGFVKWWK